MSGDLDQVERWAGAILAKTNAPQRKALARSIAMELRRSQQRRIAAAMAPDGSPYAARRPRPKDRVKDLRKRRAAMFSKLRTAKWLRVQASAAAAEVGFYGRVARLARVHQEGDVDRPEPGQRAVRYARRVLLGFTDADRSMIRDKLLAHLDGR